MTVTKTITVDDESGGFAVYTGNSTTTFFEFGFLLPEEDALLVFLDQVLTTEGFQIQNNGVVFDVAPATGVRIVLVRFSDVDQLRDWEPFGPFPAEKTEDAADKLIILKQEGGFRRLMNLYSVPDADSVLIVNDKGTDADILLWDHTDDEAGAFAAIVDTQIPPDGSPTSDADSTVYIQFTDTAIPPVDEPTAIIADRSTPAGQLLTEMSFSALGNTQPTSRSHPVGGQLDVHNFTAFFCMRWTDEDPGPMIDSDVLEFSLNKRPATFPEQYYFQWTVYDVSTTGPRSAVAAGTFELGNLLDGSGLGNVGDWFVFMLSMKNMDVSDPNRFTGYVVNLDRGIETSFTVSGIIDPNSTGDLGMRMGTEREQSSRMGFLNTYTGDVLGVFGFAGTIAAHCFHFGMALDFEIVSERRKICTPTDLVDHGIGGVNIFGEQAAYYTQGSPQLNTGWINTGNPSVFNQFEFAPEGEGPPYNYPVTTHPMGDWEYANMPLAVASGDAWQEGDQIFIDEGNQVMKYRSSLAVDGHSGLIHSNPFFSDDDPYTGAVLIESNPEGANPDTWGWVDGSIGVKGVDYDFTVNAGRAGIETLTDAGAAVLTSPHLTVAGDETTFGIIDRLTAEDVESFNGSIVWITCFEDGVVLPSTQMYAYKNAVVPSPPSNLTSWSARWETNGSEWENVLAQFSDETRFWLYSKSSRVAIWTDTGPMLALSPVRDFAGVGVNALAGFIAQSDATDFCKLYMGRTLFGRLT